MQQREVAVMWIMLLMEECTKGWVAIWTSSKWRGFPRIPGIDLHVQKGSRVLSAFSLDRIIVTGTELYALRKSFTAGWMDCLHRWENSTMYRPEQWVALQSIIGSAERRRGDGPLYACPCLQGPWGGNGDCALIAVGFIFVGKYVSTCWNDSRHSCSTGWRWTLY